MERYDLTHLQALSKLVEKASNIPVARTQPVVGAHAFSHESGIHIAAILQDPETYEYFSPEMVGGERKFILGKHSGSKALEYVVSALGFQLSKEQVCRVLERVKTEGEHKTVVTPERLLELIKEYQGRGVSRMRTLSERILGAGAGDYVDTEVDRAYVHDGTGVLTLEAWKEMGCPGPAHPERLYILFDHIVPANNSTTATLQKELREFARSKGIHFSDIGGGVCHQLMGEGEVLPGEIVVGADSHSCTLGAFGAFATGVGATDMAAVWASGTTWFRVPETIAVRLSGSFNGAVEAKDLALTVSLQTRNGRGFLPGPGIYRGRDEIALHGRPSYHDKSCNGGRGKNRAILCR